MFIIAAEGFIVKDSSKSSNYKLIMLIKLAVLSKTLTVAYSVKMPREAQMFTQASHFLNNVYSLRPAYNGMFLLPGKKKYQAHKNKLQTVYSRK